jgi:hypothetical protein
VTLSLLALVMALANAQPDPGALPLPSGPTATTAPVPDADTAAGGHGAPVDGIACGPTEMTAEHVHAHLTILEGGRTIVVPAGVGIVQHRAGDGAPCIYWLHTHDATGLLHVEAPGGDFTLGNFFDVWGQPLRRDAAAGRPGTVTAFVNGRRWNGDPARIPLTAHADIVIEIGARTPLPAAFAFPPGS